jgi:hypothetical protein
MAAVVERGMRLLSGLDARTQLLNVTGSLQLAVSEATK